MIPKETLDAINAAANTTTASSTALLLQRNKSTPMANIVDITYENFAAKFLHPSATVSVTVNPACSWFDGTKMFNKSDVTTSHNRLNVLDAKLLWRLTGESAALRSYFYSAPPPAPSRGLGAAGEIDDDDDDGAVDGNMSSSDSDGSSSDEEEKGGKKAPLTLQSRLASYQVEFAQSLLGKGKNKRRHRTKRRGGAADNQASRGKLILRSTAAADGPAGMMPSHVAGSKFGGYIPGHKSATSALDMTVSRDFLRQIMLLSPMDLQDLRLLDTALRSQSRNLVDSLHQEVRQRIARGPMNAFNLYRSTVYPLGSINSALQSSGAVAMTDAATTTAGRKVRAHLLEKMRVPTGRSGGITVEHHLRHAPTMSVQIITDQIFEAKQAAKAEEEEKKRAAAASSPAAAPAAFGNLSQLNAPSATAAAAAPAAPAGPSLTVEEIDALRYNSKGEKISDTAHKIKVMLALRELQKKAAAEQGANAAAGGPAHVVFQNIADPKDRKRNRAAAADAEKAAAVAAVTEANTRLFGVPLQEQSKPPFYLITLHGTMTWRTPTMGSQPLLPGASIESTLAYNGQDPAAHDHVNGQRPTDVLSFAFPNGISCRCDRTLTVTAQRVEVALPLRQMAFNADSLEAPAASGVDAEGTADVRSVQHVPPFIAALARERLLALGYVDCPEGIDYRGVIKKNDSEKKDGTATAKKKKKGGARTEGSDDDEAAPSLGAYGPLPQEYLTIYVRKLFIYNDHMTLRPSGVGTGFVSPAAAAASGSGRYHSNDRRAANVSDQQGRVVYSHLRVDKIDELELEHCGDAGSDDDNDETAMEHNNNTDKDKKHKEAQQQQQQMSSRQFIQQVLERSESDRAVYEALREAFSDRNMTPEQRKAAEEERQKKAAEAAEAERRAAKKKGAAKESSKPTPAAPSAAESVPTFSTTGVQQLLRRHSSLTQ